MKELRPVHTPRSVVERLERLILAKLREHVYGPLLAELAPKAKLQNADESALILALRRGHVTYSKADGVFRGSFDAATSKELKALGAKWDRPLKAWRLAEADLPPAVRAAVSAAGARFEELVKTVDERLRKILPEEIAGKNIFSEIFDNAIRTVDNNLHKTLDNITVLPKLSDGERRVIAAEYGENLALEIKEWSSGEILRLRRQITENVMSGNRYESMVRAIQTSYGVTASKARFLARQETNLLTVALKKQRYTAAGVPEYRWACVHNPHDKSPKEHTPGNVRWSHSQLNGKIFRWDDPPVTTPPGETQRRNHPGQDFNCRCAAIPVVRRFAE